MQSLYANTPKQSQQGLYPGSGVNQGGNVSRPKVAHMGMPSSQAGGVNPYGSARSPQSITHTVKTVIAPHDPLAGATKAGVTPQMAKAGVWGGSGSSWNAAKGPAGPVAMTPYVPPKLGDLNTHDSIYSGAAAKANYDYAQAGINIPTSLAQYALDKHNLDNATQADFEQNNSNLSARGMYNSGGRITDDLNRTDKYNSDLLGYNNSEGQNYVGKINAGRGTYNPATGQIEGGQYALDMSAAEADALNRYNDAHPTPTAPIVLPTTAPVAPAKTKVKVKVKPKPVIVAGGVATKGKR